MLQCDDICKGGNQHSWGKANVSTSQWQSGEGLHLWFDMVRNNSTGMSEPLCTSLLLSRNFSVLT